MSSEHSQGVTPREGATASDSTAQEKVFGTDRRTFFKSAALGSAAAAMYSGGTMFAPLAAYADDLSALNCTANDVRIVGPAQIVNEPCNCTGSFNAQVKFRVVNNTGTMRYCVTVHFCPVTLPGGGMFVPGDVVIGDVDAKSDKEYTVTIPNYPCGTGLLCFGAAGPEADGGFPKGAPCPAGQCCTTISWDVNAGCPTRVLSSKCRHQQVCIQGRGATTLDCNTSSNGVQQNCQVACGSSTTLRACTTNSAGLGPFTYRLSSDPNSTADDVVFGPTNDVCHDFNVGPITETKTFTVTITDKDGCAKSDSVTLTTEPITVSLGVSGNGSCNSGALTFTATPASANCTYLFKVDGTTVQNTSSNTYNYPADPDGNCHTVSVVRTCGNCSSAAVTRTVSQCVQSTVGNAGTTCPST